MRQLPILRLEGAQEKIVQFLEYSEIWSVTDLMLSMQQLPSLHGPTGSGHFDHKEDLSSLCEHAVRLKNGDSFCHQGRACS
jgi:hypothetical protein